MLVSQCLLTAVLIGSTSPMSTRRRQVTSAAAYRSDTNSSPAGSVCHKCPNPSQTALPIPNAPSKDLAEFNGCGPEDFHGVPGGPLVPDLIFTECCNAHDVCYDTSCQDGAFELCNAQFLTCTDRACDSLVGSSEFALSRLAQISSQCHGADDAFCTKASKLHTLRLQQSQQPEATSTVVERSSVADEVLAACKWVAELYYDAVASQGCSSFQVDPGDKYCRCV